MLFTKNWIGVETSFESNQYKTSQEINCNWNWIRIGNPTKIRISAKSELMSTIFFKLNQYRSCNRNWINVDCILVTGLVWKLKLKSNQIQNYSFNQIILLISNAKINKYILSNTLSPFWLNTFLSERKNLCYQITNHRFFKVKILSFS